MSTSKWVEKRLNQVMTRPGMWGGPEAIELQLLLLAEAWVACRRPKALVKNDRFVLDMYSDWLKKSIRDIGSGFQWQMGKDVDIIAKNFREFMDYLRQKNP